MQMKRTQKSGCQLMFIEIGKDFWHSTFIVVVLETLIVNVINFTLIAEYKICNYPIHFLHTEY